MVDPVGRVTEKWGRDGVVSTTKNVYNAIKTRANYRYRNYKKSAKTKSVYYSSRIGGGYEISCENVVAQFSINDIEEANTIRYIVDEEDDFLRACLSELTPEDIVWDIGANIGVHSCLFGKKSRKVISFEPYLPNVRSLRRNIETNGIDADIVPLALSDRDGTEMFSIPPTESPGDQWPALLPDSVSTSRQDKLENSETMEVDVKKGDTLIDNGLAPPTVLKIDVEGSSHKVIRGLQETLTSDQCRLIFVEVHLAHPGKSRPATEDFGHPPEEIQRELEEYGFDTDIIEERYADFFVKGVK